MVRRADCRSQWRKLKSRRNFKRRSRSRSTRSKNLQRKRSVWTWKIQQLWRHFWSRRISSSFGPSTWPICALVDHEEVQAWAEGSKEAIIVSVSHAWEAREHPDPCGYQLEWVAQHASLFVAAFAADIWLFFDYVSLFQFKREKEAEEQSFRRSMGNMHAMYAHESTMTFRLETLTPDESWQKAVKDGSQVTIFHFYDTSGLVEPVALDALTRNTNAYLDRGWCRAESSWSSVRGDTAQNQRIDVGREGVDTDLTGRTPVAPHVFAADMHSAAFTHRSDANAVIELQKKVFLEKVTRRRNLKQRHSWRPWLLPQLKRSAFVGVLSGAVTAFPASFP
eukprot:symbB.v1.2.021031.t1/scaffold1798.1/size163522/10